jgi:hypothetical protein
MLGDLNYYHPLGWDDLLQWMDEFYKKLILKKPNYVTALNNNDTNTYLL